MCLTLTLFYSTYSSKTLRRSIVMIGMCTLMLLVFQTGWSVTHFISKNILIEVWPFRESALMNSDLWFNALLQVIYSTSIGFVTSEELSLFSFHSKFLPFSVQGLEYGRWSLESFCTKEMRLGESYEFSYTKPIQKFILFLSEHLWCICASMCS